MNSLSRFQSAGAALLPWLLTFLTWLLARSLSMPEPLVHTAGVFMFAQVQAIENSVGRSLCPIHFARQLLAWSRSRRSPTPSTKENCHD